MVNILMVIIKMNKLINHHYYDYNFDISLHFLNITNHIQIFFIH